MVDIDVERAPHICPQCASSIVERIVERIPWRGAVDRLVAAFGHRHYRCRDCGTRFYDRPALRSAA